MIIVTVTMASYWNIPGPGLDPGFQRPLNTGVPWEGSQPSHVNKRQRQPSVERRTIYEVTSKVILFIFQAAFNSASTCARFPAKTISDVLLAAAG